MIAKFDSALCTSPKNISVISCGLDLFYFYITNSLFTKAFNDVLPRIPEPSDETEDADQTVISSFWEAKGTLEQLCCVLSNATMYYKKSLEANPLNFDSSLKMASVHLELGELNEVGFDFMNFLKRLSYVTYFPIG